MSACCRKSPALQIRPDVQIRGWYLMYLGRIPQPQEVQAWLNQLNRGATFIDLQVGILASPEYYQICNNNPTVFVQSIYQLILGRPVTQAELGILVQQLAINFRGDRTRFVQNAIANN